MRRILWIGMLASKLTGPGLSTGPRVPNVEKCVEKSLTKVITAGIVISVIVLQKPVRPATQGVPAGALFFYKFQVVTRQMAKPFLTYQQQIEKLRTEKGLIISNEAYAEAMLRQNSYFALITGYKHLFKNKTTKKYKDGTRFEDIVTLYEFDRGLRELFLKYLCRVERHIRSLLSYYFSEKHGEAQEKYLDKANYRYTGADIVRVDRLVYKLTSIIHNPDSQYEYIRHYVSQNHNVPLWVLLNTVTFGTLSKMYMLLPQDIQIKISTNFQGINESQLGSILSILSRFRNVCAHNERLFSYRVKASIPDLLLHQKLSLPKTGTQYSCGKSDLFAVVITLRYLLSKNDFLTLKQELVLLINKFKRSTTAIQEKELLSAMGFPENWTSITRFRKL